MLTSNPLPELISGANCVSLAVGRHPRDATRGGSMRRGALRGPHLTRERGRDAGRHTAAARCQRAITNSEGGRGAATLYARRRILHSVFSDTMGRGVRVLKYEYEYGRRARARAARLVESRLPARPPILPTKTRPRESGDRCPVSPASFPLRRSRDFPARRHLPWRTKPRPGSDSPRRPNSAGIVAENCRVRLRNADEGIVVDVPPICFRAALVAQTRRHLRPFFHMTTRRADI